jgi:hypothetical protein
MRNYRAFAISRRILRFADELNFGFTFAVKNIQAASGKILGGFLGAPLAGSKKSIFFQHRLHFRVQLHALAALRAANPGLPEAANRVFQFLAGHVRALQRRKQVQC